MTSSNFLDWLPLDLKKELLYYFWGNDFKVVYNLPYFPELNDDESFWKTLYSKHFRSYPTAKELYFRTCDEIEDQRDHLDYLDSNNDKSLHEWLVGVIISRNYYNALPYIMKTSDKVTYRTLEDVTIQNNVGVLEFLMKNHVDQNNLLNYFQHIIFDYGRVDLFKHLMPAKVTININEILVRVVWSISHNINSNEKIYKKKKKLAIIRYLLSLGADGKLISDNIKSLL